jgi:small subunit ribosomal protein S18
MTATTNSQRPGVGVVPPHNLEAERSVLGAVLLADRHLLAANRFDVRSRTVMSTNPQCRFGSSLATRPDRTRARTTVRSRRPAPIVRGARVAKQRKRPARIRRDRKDGATSGRRKSCPYCRDKVDQVDYKDVAALRRFISERGKIRSRRITGACRMSPRAGMSAPSAASGPVVARAQTGGGRERTATG